MNLSREPKKDLKPFDIESILNTETDDTLAREVAPTNDIPTEKRKKISDTIFSRGKPTERRYADRQRKPHGPRIGTRVSSNHSQVFLDKLKELEARRVVRLEIKQNDDSVFPISAVHLIPPKMILDDLGHFLNPLWECNDDVLLPAVKQYFRHRALIPHDGKRFNSSWSRSTSLVYNTGQKKNNDIFKIEQYIERGISTASIIQPIFATKNTSTVATSP
jgi:hypothetical protein